MLHSIEKRVEWRRVSEMLSDISFPAHIRSENETQTASPTQPGNTIHGSVLNLVTSCRASCEVPPGKCSKDRTGLWKHRSHCSESGNKQLGEDNAASPLRQMCGSGFYPNIMLKWLEKM